MYRIYQATHTPTGRVYIGLTTRQLFQRIGQHLVVAEYKRTPFQQFLHTTEYADWKWEVLCEIAERGLAYETEAQMIRDAEARGPVLNEHGRIAKGTTLSWLSEHQFKPGTTPWNAGKSGVYSADTISKMRIAKLRKPATKAVYTDQDRQNLRDAQQCKAVRCVETGQEFQSISLAATAMGLNRADVRRVLQGKRSSAKGYTFVYVDSSAA